MKSPILKFNYISFINISFANCDEVTLTVDLTFNPVVVCLSYGGQLVMT
jgi:hypothetical protein